MQPSITLRVAQEVDPRFSSYLLCVYDFDPSPPQAAATNALITIWAFPVALGSPLVAAMTLDAHGDPVTFKNRILNRPADSDSLLLGALLITFGIAVLARTFYLTQWQNRRPTL